MINIARRYSVTVEAIIAANNISNPNHIEVGMTLLIPQP
jgi:LysM repeat protein